MSRLGRQLAILLSIALAAGVLSGCAAVAPSASTATGSQRSITVLGRGTVSAAPDLAQANVGVETLAATVADASQQNNAKMTAIIAQLKELGIADKDIQTSNFSINTERSGPAESAVQYRVSNMVEIKIRDLNKVGQVLDSVVQAGANQVWGVSFTIEDQSKLEAEARGKAVENAQQRAAALAKLAQVQLGSVLEVSESGATGPVVRTDLALAKGMGAAGDVPISNGEVQVVFQVQVTYGIK
jgi:uncharacterized protein